MDTWSATSGLQICVHNGKGHPRRPLSGRVRNSSLLILSFRGKFVINITNKNVGSLYKMFPNCTRLGLTMRHAWHVGPAFGFLSFTLLLNCYVVLFCLWSLSCLEHLTSTFWAPYRLGLFSDHRRCNCIFKGGKKKHFHRETHRRDARKPVLAGIAGRHHLRRFQECQPRFRPSEMPFG